ncbi:unnamed protein product [Protopolystoma xenopodis]|uniref:Uncharacterized protein n=1 Tax=Protopolystoma xenopodis TaxID=117903 RepID=A0A3S5CIR4_9PLAT|nr:unnamed protein product [Protopolystoma xenopodis]
MMTGERPNWYWRICWLIITPSLIVFLLVFMLIKRQPLQLDNYNFPRWADCLSNLVAAFPIICIPGWMAYKFCKEGGFIVGFIYFQSTFQL